jgi:hypothetical protein
MYIWRSERQKLNKFWAARWNILNLGRGHTKETGNCNFRELLSDWFEHEEPNWAAKMEETSMELQRN